MKNIILLLFLLFTCNISFCQEPPAHFVIQGLTEDRVDNIYYFQTNTYIDRVSNDDRFIAYRNFILKDTFTIHNQDYFLDFITYSDQYNYSLVLIDYENNEKYLIISKNYIKEDTLTLTRKEYNLNKEEAKKYSRIYFYKDEYENEDGMSIMIRGEKFLPQKYNIVSLKIIHKSSKKIMEIYVRCDHDFDYGEKIVAENFHFKEGSFFYDMFQSCDSSRLYHRYSDDLMYHHGSRINLSDLHEISTEKLNELLQTFTFIIDYTRLCKDKDLVEEIFDIHIYPYCCKNGMILPNFNDNKIMLPCFSSRYMHIFIDTVNFFPDKRDIVLLNIIHKPSRKEMKIYMQLDQNLRLGEEIILDGLSFKEGNFFYDNIDYRKWIQPHTMHVIAKIDLSDMENHEISEKKLNELLQNINANE